MIPLREGYRYKIDILEKTNAGVRFITMIGKLQKIDEFYIWLNGESFKIENIVKVEKNINQL